jgi:N-acyl-D-aspartate/D-glutamate deacylase
VRERLKREIQTGSPGWWNIVEAAGGWNGVVLANARNPANAKYNGMRIPDIAKAMGKSEADAAWDLVLEGQGRVMAIYHMMSEPDVETALKFPWTSIGSDAGAALSATQGDDLGLPHPRAYGNHVRVISRYVKERKVLTLEEAVRKMTSQAAAAVGLGEVGLIQEGLRANLVVFDPEVVADKATFEDPVQFPVGVRDVLVGGEFVVRGGKLTGQRPGKVVE